MIEHLDGREKALEPLGWTGREAEWIALVCLHSGVFTRAQFCFYFDARRNRAHRFVQALVERRAAVEWNALTFNGGAKACLISGKPIYQALGAENILHRRTASLNVVMRRLLSLDFVLERPGLNWLPTEAEKVEFFEGIGLDRRLIPRRVYFGAVGKQRHYFALKLPVAVDAKSVTFVYVDPGHQTDSELRSWGLAHGRLWDALRAKGRQVRVITIAAEDEPIERAERVLRRWAATAPGKPSEGLTAKQEIKAIDRRYGSSRTGNLWSSTEGCRGSREDGQWSYNVSPKRSSRKGYRLMTTRRGELPGLPRPMRGLGAEWRTPRSGRDVETETGEVFVGTSADPECHRDRGGVGPRFDPVTFHNLILLSLSF